MKTAKSSRMHGILLSALTGAFLVGSGCVATRGRPVYTSSQSSQSYRVEFGTVTGVNEVVIDGNTAGTFSYGQFGGAAVGAAVASGGDVGRAVGVAAGSIVGAVAGRQIEKAVTRKEGYEIHIALDNGDQIMVVQEQDKGGFQDGDRVRVMIGGNTARVMH